MRYVFIISESLLPALLFQDFPVIFHGVTGVDEREANSPSFFNVAEVQMLMDYLKKILGTQGKNGLSKIEPKDIGIVAPYRKQVCSWGMGLRRLVYLYPFTYYCQ